MDFNSTLQSVVYVTETNGSTTSVLNFANTPNTLVCVRKQSYVEPVGGITNTSLNLLIYRDAEVDKNEKIVCINGSTQSKSTLYQKNVRHTPTLKAFLTAHRKGDVKHLQIFDNDLDRSSSGSQTLQFNKGLPLDQHNALQEGNVYLLIQNAKKPRQNTTQVPTHVILGGKDLEVFAKLIIELEMFYKSLENISTNVEHSNRIVESLLAEATAAKNRIPKARKIAKKRKIVESEEDEFVITEDATEGVFLHKQKTTLIERLNLYIFKQKNIC